MKAGIKNKWRIAQGRRGRKKEGIGMRREERNKAFKLRRKRTIGNIKYKVDERKAMKGRKK